MTSQEKAKRSYFKEFIGVYRFTAMILLNTLIGLFFLNIFFFYYFKRIDSSVKNIISQQYYDINLELIYQDMSFPEINALLKETWSRNYMYEPFTQFKERPYKGGYVNIDNNGFRNTKNQGPWPPRSESINIFLFGGSTTFGYGVSDNQTVASYLQEYLNEKFGRDVRVYNFGRGYYYSTQELFLYLQLLKSGFVPDFAIFIDGLNDFAFHNDEPYFSSRLRELFDPDTIGMTKKLISMTSLFRGAEMVRNIVASRLQKKTIEPKNGPEKEVDQNKTYNNSEVLDKVINRYLMNKKLIEAASNIFGVQPIFVWQPIPTYHYDPSCHPFLKGDFEELNYSRYGYARLADLIREKPMGSNYIWCADIQKELKKPLYIDKVHYSPSFSKLFAEVIADRLVAGFNLKKRSEPITSDHH